MTAAELLGRAVVEQGMFAQAFPRFGPERRGAPVSAFTRISDEPIDIRSMIYEPDAVVVLDPTLAKSVDLTGGLKNGGIIVLNSSPNRIGEKKEEWSGFRLAVADASAVSREKIKVNIVSTSILGAVARALQFVDLSILERVVEDRFGSLNVEAVRETYNRTAMFGRW